MPPDDRPVEPAGSERAARRDVADFEGVSAAVVDAVSAATTRDPLELPQLADVVDTDALESLFSRVGDGTVDGFVRFSYAGCTVVVGADGRVEATPESTR